jgi:tRNA G18 (ribose-2'-O)-methylase SpoU
MNSLNVIDQYKEMENAKIKEDLQRKSFPYAIMMQHVNGDFNISTFIRNGNAFGVERIFYWGKRQWDRRGAVGSHNYKQLDHLKSEDDIISLKEHYRFVAIENNIIYPCKDLHTFQPQPNDLYIFGEESKGIEDWVLDICDEYVYIPQFGSVRSLNVGTASGIIMNYVTNYFKH